MRTLLLIALFIVVQVVFAKDYKIQLIQESLAITKPTFDRRINEYCFGAKIHRYNNNQIICFFGRMITILGRSIFIRKKIRKINVMRIVEKVNSLYSKRKENSNFNEWYLNNSTCMIPALRDEAYCKGVEDLTIIKKPCYFVHGVGESGGNVILRKFKDYWGDLQLLMPQCTDFNFLYMDTRSNSYNSPFLLRKVCELITGKPDQRIIKNSYVFTHSMGGLTMTNAIKQGYCGVDKLSARIYMSQPPMKGSLSALFVDNVCKGIHGTVLQTGAKFMNYCKPGVEGAWPAYFPMAPGFKDLKDLDIIQGIYADGLLCGNCNASTICGIKATEAVFLKALGVLASQPYPNDGMVSLESCIPPNLNNVMHNDPTYNFYNIPGNHADGTCRNGDSSFQNIYACEWFMNRYMIK